MAAQAIMHGTFSRLCSSLTDRRAGPILDGRPGGPVFVRRIEAGGGGRKPAPVLSIPAGSRYSEPLDHQHMEGNMTSIEQIYDAVRCLPLADRLRLVERVVHDAVESSEEQTSPGVEETGSLIGLFAKEPGLIHSHSMGCHFRE